MGISYGFGYVSERRERVGEEVSEWVAEGGEGAFLEVRWGRGGSMGMGREGRGEWEGWTFFVCAEGSVGGLVGDFVEEFVHFAFFVLGLFGGGGFSGWWWRLVWGFRCWCCLVLLGWFNAGCCCCYSFFFY